METALVLSLFLIPLFFVITDGAIVFYNYHIITNASREGARAGIRSASIPSESAIERIINLYCFRPVYSAYGCH